VASTYAGIDPGHSGAIAFLRYRKVIAIHPMPLRKVSSTAVEIHAKDLSDLLRSYGSLSCLGIEAVHATPKFGSKSSFTFGKGFGAILAVVELLGLSHVRIKPQEWKAKILVGTDKSKQAAIAYVQRLHRGVNLIPPGEEAPSHDWAEAVCLAEYVQRM
jgi:crossover junction endodeoxyribonuclease RuvC